MPDVIPNGAMTKKTDRVIKYPGLKEDVYVPQFKPDRSILERLNLNSKDLIVSCDPSYRGPLPQSRKRCAFP